MVTSQQEENGMKILNRLDELIAVKERNEGRRLPLRVITEETGLGISTIWSWRHNTVTRYDATVIAALCKWVPCEVGELFIVMDTDGNAGIPIPEDQNEAFAYG